MGIKVKGRGYCLEADPTTSKWTTTGQHTTLAGETRAQDAILSSIGAKRERWLGTIAVATEVSRYSGEYLEAAKELVRELNTLAIQGDSQIWLFK